MLISITPSAAAAGVGGRALPAGMDDGDRPPEGKNDSGRSESPAPPLNILAECGLDVDGFPKPLGAGDIPLRGEAPKPPSACNRKGPGTGRARVLKISNELSTPLGFGGFGGFAP